MSILDIILEGDPRLRQKATRIKSFDDGLRKLAASMHATMEAAPGVGLAGPQVGVMRRIIVMHVPPDYDEEGEEEVVMTLLNPELVKSQGRQVGQEGCLSIPGWVGEVPRYQSVLVKGMDLDGRQVRIKAKGFFARILQHEIDHLDGILFIDRVEDESSLFQVSEDEAGDVLAE